MVSLVVMALYVPTPSNCSADQVEVNAITNLASQTFRAVTSDDKTVFVAPQSRLVANIENIHNNAIALGLDAPNNDSGALPMQLEKTKLASRRHDNTDTDRYDNSDTCPSTNMFYIG